MYPCRMNATIFRDSNEIDLPAVRSFVDQMYEEDAAAHGGTPDIDLTFKELKTRPDKGRLLLIERDGTPVGYAIIVFFWSNEYRGNSIDIDELFIAENSR